MTTPRNRHTWEPDRIAVGHINQGFWVCRKCGVTGGKIVDERPNWVEQQESRSPFLAGTPLINLPDDCEEARAEILAYIQKYPVWQEYLDKVTKPKYR